MKTGECPLYSPNIFEDFPSIGSALSVKSSPPEDFIRSHLITILEDKLPENIVRICQVHGSQIHVITDNSQIASVNNKNGDGLMTDLANIGLLIRVADCAPLAIFDESGSAIALIHAGWKGIEKGIIENAIVKFIDFGIVVDKLVAYIGPCIGPEDYEVGNEFLEKFQRNILNRNSKLFFDLPGEIELRLKKLGVLQIEKFPLSTFSTNWLYSFRRDKTDGGRIFFYLWKKTD